MEEEEDLDNYLLENGATVVTSDEINETVGDSMNEDVGSNFVDITGYLENIKKWAEDQNDATKIAAVAKNLRDLAWEMFVISIKKGGDTARDKKEQIQGEQVCGPCEEPFVDNENSGVCSICQEFCCANCCKECDECEDKLICGICFSYFVAEHAELSDVPPEYWTCFECCDILREMAEHRWHSGEN